MREKKHQNIVKGDKNLVKKWQNTSEKATQNLLKKLTKNIIKKTPNNWNKIDKKSEKSVEKEQQNVWNFDPEKHKVACRLEDKKSLKKNNL